MLKWREAPEDEDDPAVMSSMKTYDLPIGMSYIRRSKVWGYLPFSPTFKGFSWERESVVNSGMYEVVLLHLINIHEFLTWFYWENRTHYFPSVLMVHPVHTAMTALTII